MKRITKETLFKYLLALALAAGYVFILSYHLAAINSSDSPEAWSEFSHIFDASMIFAPVVYGARPAWPVLDPGRALLDGLVFLLPNASLILFRAWVQVLSLLLPLATAVALVRRLRPISWKKGLALVLFSVLIFEAGPIYYHLLLGPILVLALFDRKKMSRTYLVVILASLWEGICRINWFPLPGVLAACLFLLEQEQGEQSRMRYVRHPLGLAAGGSIAALGSYLVYSRASADPMLALDPRYNYSFWPLRLLPNNFYPLGVLGGLLLLSAPFLVFLAGFVIRKWRGYVWLRLVGLALALAAFGAGGLLVSMRIGGTFNLHNLDGFFLLLLVITFYVYLERFRPDHDLPAGPIFAGPARLAWQTAVVLIPLFYVGFMNKPATAAPVHIDDRVVQTIIRNYGLSGKPVLFLDYRDLLAFKEAQANLYLPYDKVILMEMIMANQTAYLNTFNDHIYNHDYALIIATGQYYDTRDVKTDILAPEENAWVHYVSIPIVDNYTPIYRQGDLFIYVPDAPRKPASH